MIKVCEKVGKKEEKKKANRKYVLLFELRKRRKCNYSKGETWGEKKKLESSGRKRALLKTTVFLLSFSE